MQLGESHRVRMDDLLYLINDKTHGHVILDTTRLQEVTYGNGMNEEQG